jgi:hypothetical protein
LRFCWAGAGRLGGSPAGAVLDELVVRLVRLGGLTVLTDSIAIRRWAELRASI